MNTVYFKPEVEVCYVGIASKCFEILEHQHGGEGRPESHLGLQGPAVVGSDAEEDEDEEGEGAEEDDEEGEEAGAEEVEDTESEEDDEEDVDSDLGGTREGDAVRPRLREILFYDDKVGIFKARHGRL